MNVKCVLNEQKLLFIFIYIFFFVRHFGAFYQIVCYLSGFAVRIVTVVTQKKKIVLAHCSSPSNVTLLDLYVLRVKI